MRLSVAMGLVGATAVLCAWWARHREANVPWQRVGGMIGWTEPQMIARIGQPAHIFEEELPDETAHSIRPTPPARFFRTLIFDTFDGRFVAWYSSDGGPYTCFRSTWVDRNYYY